MGRKECSLSDDFAMSIGVVTCDYSRIDIFSTFISSFSIGQSGQHRPHFIPVSSSFSAFIFFDLKITDTSGRRVGVGVYKKIRPLVIPNDNNNRINTFHPILFVAGVMALSRRGWSVSNLPFVKIAGFWVKIACFAMGDQHFTYHLRYKMVSEKA